MGYRVITGYSAAMDLAGVKKLLEIVGGKLVYSESNDEDNICINEPVLNKDFFQFIEKENYYEFVNFIEKLPIINIQDILEMNEFADYDTDEDTLKYFIAKYEKVTISNDKKLLENSIKEPKHLCDKEKVFKV